MLNPLLRSLAFSAGTDNHDPLAGKAFVTREGGRFRTSSLNVWILSDSSGYLDGLAGSSLLIKTHTVPPATMPAPIPIAQGESSIPPQPGTAAAATLRFRLFSSFCDCESSRVVCWPCGSVVVPVSSWIDRSPFRAAIWTLPSTSLTSNSVQTSETGDTVTPPARVASNFEVEMVTPPCSNLRAPPSY